MAKPTKNNRITCEWHKAGSSWAVGYHTGVDFGAVTPGKAGDDVFAVTGGKVVSYQGQPWGGSYGNQVIIQAPDGTRHLYAHLKSVNVKLLKSGKVAEGDLIGQMGQSTNRDSGLPVHLHYEVRKEPYRYGKDDIDPTPYLGEDVNAKTPAKGAVKKPAAKKAAPKK